MDEATVGAAQCDLCGACCRTFPVLVSIRDGSREPRIAEEAPRLEPWNRSAEWEFKLHPLPFSRGCLFLGDDDRCSVYESRPSVCRAFAAGSEGCTEARARIGLPPLRGHGAHLGPGESLEGKVS